MSREDLFRIFALMRAGIYITRNRRKPGVAFSPYQICTPDGITIHCILMGSNSKQCVIVAHSFGVGSMYKDIVELSELLSEKYSVVNFDFRGHGRSTGVYNPGFAGVCQDMKTVLKDLRIRGFEKVAVVGFSLGAAAAVLSAADGEELDALVCIGCPPRLPEPPGMRTGHVISRAFLRKIGVRVGQAVEDGPTPEECAPTLPAIPKFFIFGEIEVFPRADIESFFEKISEPKEIRFTPGAWHASLQGNEEIIREWLERHF